MFYGRQRVTAAGIFCYKITVILGLKSLFLGRYPRFRMKFLKKFKKNEKKNKKMC